MNKKYNNNQIIRLHLEGLTDKEIAKEVGCTPNQMANKRRDLGLKPNRPSENYCLSKEELEVLIGTLLGDSCVRYVHKECKYPSFTCSHSEAQEEWFMWKYNKLKNIISSYNKYDLKSNGIILDHCKIQATGKNMKCLKEIRELFYINGIKHIPINYIKNNFTKVSLYCMYMDDGSYDINSNSYLINTQCFSIEELQDFTKFLEDKFNLFFNIKSDHVLYLRHKSNEVFKQILFNLNKCDTMAYKLGASYR